MAIATDLISVSLEGRELPLSERLRKPFPWVEFLTNRERVAFADELLAVARASASIGDYSRLLVTFESWRSTAEAQALDYRVDGALEWLDEPIPVPDPRLP